MSRMGNKAAKLALVAVFLAFCATRALGEIVIIGLTAEIAELRDPGDLLEGRIKIGDIITGSYTYDSDTPDRNPLPGVGDYWYSSTPYGIKVTAGDFVFQTDPDDVDFLIEIINDYTGLDAYTVRSYYNLPLSNGVYVDQISWQLDDYSCTAVSTTKLPSTPPVLEDWQSIYGLHITFGDMGSRMMRAHVTSVELIPEPGTFTLLILGAVALLKRGRS